VVWLRGGNASNGKISRLSVTFNTKYSLNVDFLAGLDAGFGDELFAHVVNILDKPNKIWWMLDWNNSAVISESFDFGDGKMSCIVLS